MEKSGLKNEQSLSGTFTSDKIVTTKAILSHNLIRNNEKLDSLILSLQQQQQQQQQQLSSCWTGNRSSMPINHEKAT